MLSENEYLLDDDMSTLLTRLPKSTQFMWGLERTESHLNDSVYVINELPNRYLACKHIYLGPYVELNLDMESDPGFYLEMNSEGEGLNMGSDEDEDEDQDQDLGMDMDMDSYEGDYSGSE